MVKVRNIGIFGKCNVGKSTLINMLAGQEVAIVSSQLGTTTDAVAKPYELLPLGPVTFYDTAGSGFDGCATAGEFHPCSLWQTENDPGLHRYPCIIMYCLTVYFSSWVTKYGGVDRRDFCKMYRKEYHEYF